MMTELDSKKNYLANAFTESEEMSARILMNLEKKNGLCIRCLNKPLMSLVLAYLGGSSSSASAVCKYWMLLSKPRDAAPPAALSPAPAPSSDSK